MSELLRVENLVKHFAVDQGVVASHLGKKVHAVDGVSFSVNKGETLGLVGESGCGKSTTGRCIIRLLEPSAGSITFDGTDVRSLRGKALQSFRRDVQFIFQDPYASLNPRMTIGEIVSEPMVVHRIGTPATRRTRAKELLDVVGLNPEHINRYPHEFSGGQRQRIGIARALALNPRLLICDEPVSALDVSIQAQVINLLDELQDRFELTYVFIAHDLSVVRHISDRVAVMYLGKIVEVGGWLGLYDQPHHPYTQSLLSAVPVPDPDKQRSRERIILEGDVPSPIDPPTGCRFHTRCPIAQDICTATEPELREVADGHEAACHFAKPFPITAEAPAAVAGEGAVAG
ncbi:MAG: dipeptide ABC transporter ATP-binding protein [Actinobacteria bacterium]|nr:dipeptide ABC transporter ATP-binding protein [Actinomycetota bacterium]